MKKKEPKPKVARLPPATRRKSSRPPPGDEPELVKMSVLAQRSEVPSATIKHYLREGLLPGPARRTSRNMAFYDAALVERIRAIKRLQREHFLPLSVIKDVLEGKQAGGDASAAQAIERALERGSENAGKTRAELLAQGVKAGDLDWLTQLGLLRPKTVDGEARYVGDDVELLRVLGASRKVGITPQMLPTSILQDYVLALRQLVRVELSLFRNGVIPIAGDDLPTIAEAATELSERLVVVLRRKLLLPTLRELIRDAKG